MNKLLGMIAILSCCPPALAFDNIEADAAYDGAIKQEITSEFLQGLKMLQIQADTLGTAAREKDIKTLQQQMYNKSVLMGRCLDVTVTLKKKSSGRISLEKYARECTQKHLNFIAKEPAVPILCTYMKFWQNPAYDFLGSDSMSPATDYLAIKACYDRLTARARLEHELGLGWERLR
jgi:hypothetical protein